MSDTPTSGKITPFHLARRAIVYIRQSSDHQVRNNLESQRLQYALVERARGLGWLQVECVDTDLGASASLGATHRAGFDSVLAAVARGEVGIILAREVSRLSRTDKDFCRLLELCQVFGTLLGDADQIYDPVLMDDQLILGIKGTLSVVELRVLRLRLIQGVQAKASRGELVRLLPAGYELDGERHPVLSPDERVRDAMAQVFTTFRTTWSVRQTLLWFQSEARLVPVRQRRGNRWLLHWRLPTQSFLTDVLSNPWYAGAYVYGRRATQVDYKDGVLVRRVGRRRPPEACTVFLRDHHEGYITWDQFEEHRRIMTRNSHTVGAATASSPIRTGSGLLAGLLRCGRCGRHLHVRYWGRAGTAPRYLCVGTYEAGGEYCLGFGGRAAETAVSAELLRVISPLGLAASEAALERRTEEDDSRRRALELALRQLEFEARRAFEQYDEADPRNRLVAAELERRWNAKLEEAARVRSTLDGLSPRTALVGQEERETIAWLGSHFAQVWSHPDCPGELKKKILRTLIHEVIVDLDEVRQQLSFTIHWAGGTHTRLEVTTPSKGKAQATATSDLDVISALAVRYGDDDIARVLTRMGSRTGKGLRWTRERVKSARTRAAIAGRAKTIESPELLNMNAAARYSGVSDTTIRKLVDAGLIRNEQTIPWAPWEIPRGDLERDAVKQVLRHLQTTGRLVLTPTCSSGQQELF
jgi:DNA invertase Pin-like site-specific DNA recombinase